ncbi:MAG: hypothetical protein JWL60_2269 [Gemmatimonadetes bacterium]|jgi:protein CpxP|nr:hypothetical protein [Gemmatimonadota bacterium]
MTRRIVPLLALAGLLAACSSGAANSPEPGAPGTSRGEDGRAAGGPGGRGGRGGRGGEGMGQREDLVMRGITLSPGQQQRIQAIRASYRTQMQQLREQGGADRDATRERVQALMDRQQTEVRAVLTAEQQAQFDRNVTEMRERVRGRRPGREARD